MLCVVYCLSEIFTAGFHFSFGVAFFKSRKIPALETGFTDKDHNTPRFSETMLGKLGTCFSFFFQFRLFLFFIVKKQNATKKKPIFIVLPSRASRPFP